jgi:hypothetical protein
MRTPGGESFVKRLETRIALALARAQQGVTAQSAGANHLETISPNIVIGPANGIAFQSTGFTSQTGHVHVTVSVAFEQGGGTLAVGDTVNVQLVRDGAVFLGIPIRQTVTGSPTGQFSVSNAVDDTVTPGSTHFWAASLICNNAHSIALAAKAGILHIQEQAG